MVLALRKLTVKILLPITAHSAFPPLSVPLRSPQGCVPMQKCPLTNRNLSGVLQTVQKISLSGEFPSLRYVNLCSAQICSLDSLHRNDLSALSIYSFLEFKLLSLATPLIFSLNTGVTPSDRCFSHSARDGCTICSTREKPHDHIYLRENVMNLCIGKGN